MVFSCIILKRIQVVLREIAVGKPLVVLMWRSYMQYLTSILPTEMTDMFIETFNKNQIILQNSRVDDWKSIGVGP